MSVDPLAVIRRYYRPGTPAFRVMVAHGEQVAAAALAAADRVAHLEPDRVFVREAAMLHDIGICLTRAPGLGLHGSHPYICHGYLGRELLAAEGLGRHALVCERHVGAGISAVQIRRRGLPLPARDMLPETLEEQLICYADTFFSKNGSGPATAKPLDRIEKTLASYGEAQLDRFRRWHARFGPL